MRWTEFNMQLELGYKHKIKISTDFSPYFTALLPEFQESDFVGEETTLTSFHNAYNQ